MNKTILIKFKIYKNITQVDVETVTDLLQPYLQSNEVKLQPLFDQLRQSIPDKYSNRCIDIIFSIYGLGTNSTYCSTDIRYPGKLRKYVQDTSNIIVNKLNGLLCSIFTVAVNSFDATQTQKIDE